ncbi:MAG TPA: hypothetical protein VMQ10_09565, partial [Spirochaetia bacterium]|nr:hypothetical protein [Spirochaetia bacterium]
CTACRRPRRPTPAQKAWLSAHVKGKLPTTFHGAGCDECGQSGYRGRTVVSEIFAVDERVEEMIVQNQSRKVMEDYYNGMGSRFLFSDAIRAVTEGITTLEEVERVILTR